MGQSEVHSTTTKTRDCLKNKAEGEKQTSPKLPSDLHTRTVVHMTSNTQIFSVFVLRHNLPIATAGLKLTMELRFLPPKCNNTPSLHTKF